MFNDLGNMNIWGRLRRGGGLKVRGKPNVLTQRLLGGRKRRAGAKYKRKGWKS